MSPPTQRVEKHCVGLNDVFTIAVGRPRRRVSNFAQMMFMIVWNDRG
jgi:hypothetical protein